MKDSAVCNSRVEGKLAKAGCSLMDGQPDTSAKWASHVSKGHPCANVPVKCTGGECGRFVWSYNLTSHWEKNHRDTAMPPALSKKAKVLARERKLGGSRCREQENTEDLEMSLALFVCLCLWHRHMVYK